MTETRNVTPEELEKLVVGLGKKAPGAVRVAMRAAVQHMVRDVVKNRMTGQYLGVDTGTGRRSIKGRVTKVGMDNVRGAIGSKLLYIKAHEQGFKGTVQVTSHKRKPRKGAKRGKKRGTGIVKAHTRKMNIRARRFLRDTVLQEVGRLNKASRTSPLTSRVVRALKIVAATGKLPKVNQLGVK